VTINAEAVRRIAPRAGSSVGGFPFRARGALLGGMRLDGIEGHKILTLGFLVAVPRDPGFERRVAAQAFLFEGGAEHREGDRADVRNRQ
jgi:hypothetical protein